MSSFAQVSPIKPYNLASLMPDNINNADSQGHPLSSRLHAMKSKHYPMSCIPGAPRCFFALASPLDNGSATPNDVAQRSIVSSCQVAPYHHAGASSQVPSPTDIKDLKERLVVVHFETVGTTNDPNQIRSDMYHPPIKTYGTHRMQKSRLYSPQLA